MRRASPDHRRDRRRTGPPDLSVPPALRSEGRDRRGGPAGPAGTIGPPGPLARRDNRVHRRGRTNGPAAQGLTGSSRSSRAPPDRKAPPARRVDQQHFTISPVDSPATVPADVTQNVILVNNTNPSRSLSPFRRRPRPARTSRWFSTISRCYRADTPTCCRRWRPDFGFVTATVCASGCTNTSFPVNFFAHFVSDGNHRWYCVTTTRERRS